MRSATAGADDGETSAIKFGTFLLMQSPSARSSAEIYGRGVDIAQAAEALGFRNIWLAEHHFSSTLPCCARWSSLLGK